MCFSYWLRDVISDAEGAPCLALLTLHQVKLLEVLHSLEEDAHSFPRFIFFIMDCFLVGMPLLLSHVEIVVDKCSEIHPSKVMERWSQVRLKARVSQCFRFLAKHNIS